MFNVVEFEFGLIEMIFVPVKLNKEVFSMFSSAEIFMMSGVLVGYAVISVWLVFSMVVKPSAIEKGRRFRFVGVSIFHFIVSSNGL